MGNTNIKNPDYNAIRTTLRSIGKEDDVLKSAKANYSIGKEEILVDSHLELSGLESEQAYSASTMAGLDLLNTLELRREWSKYIKHGFYLMVGVQVLIIPVLLLLMFLTQEITFDKIHGIIYTVIGANFVQIIGLVLVVVKFLFPPDIEQRKD